MREDFTPLRSVLYMPSSNERALEKARTIPCDGLILDLEDAVAPDAKAAAREAACAAVATVASAERTPDAALTPCSASSRYSEASRRSAPKVRAPTASGM